MDSEFFMKHGSRTAIGLLLQWWVIYTVGAFNLVLILTVFTGALLIYWKLGYLKGTRVEKIIDSYKPYLIAISVGAKMAKDKIFKPSYPVTGQLNGTGESFSITYTYNGKVNIINLPYRNPTTLMTKLFNVYLVRNGKEIDITQDPFIPYMITAKQMGGQKIIVQDLSGDIVYEFKGDTPVVF